LEPGGRKVGGRDGGVEGRAAMRRKTTPMLVRRSYLGLSHWNLEERRKRGREGGRV